MRSVRAVALQAVLVVLLTACATNRAPHPGAASSPSPPVPVPSVSPVATPAVLPTLAPTSTLAAIKPRNTPTGIAGATNGSVSPLLLIAVDANCLAYGPAAPSLGRLFSLARASGVSLGATICYRPVSLQTADRSSACSSGNCACAAKGGTSMHGWGEAADLRDATGAVNSFTSATYNWLVQDAARFGWNHPGWAVPGGSPCPEPWHWEWVGDGGTLKAPPVKADVVGLVPTASGQGYRVVTGLGASAGLGDATASPAIPSLARLVVAAAAAPGAIGGRGAWLVTAAGTVYPVDGAPVLGSVSPPLPVDGGVSVVAMAATPSGKGYWLLGSDGALSAFGDAAVLPGAAGGSGRDFVGLAADASGKGAWLASSDGQVTAVGDAPSLGSAPVTRAVDPVVAMAGTPSGKGYWLATAAGRVFPFGDAVFAGWAPSGLVEPVVSITPTRSGRGYWLVTAGGAVYALGDAPFLGNA